MDFPSCLCLEVYLVEIEDEIIFLSTSHLEIHLPLLWLAGGYLEISDTSPELCHSYTKHLVLLQSPTSSVHALYSESNNSRRLPLNYAQCMLNPGNCASYTLGQQKNPREKLPWGRFHLPAGQALASGIVWHWAGGMCHLHACSFPPKILPTRLINASNKYHTSFLRLSNCSYTTTSITLRFQSICFWFCNPNSYSC